MKLHLPCKLRVALLAALIAFPGITCAPAYGEDGNGGTLTNNRIYTNGTWTGAISGSMTLDSYETLDIVGNGQAGISLANEEAEVLISNSGEVNLLRDADVAYFNYRAVSNSGTLTFSGNRKVLFSSTGEINAATLDNHDSGTVVFEDNGEVLFENNTAGWEGAGRNDHGSTMRFSRNGDVTFSANSSRDGNGGALSNNGGTLLFENGGSVLFSGNTAGCSGGALFNRDQGLVGFSGNTSVTFSGNTVTGSWQYGGAICNSDPGSTVSFAGNGSVVFSDNQAMGSSSMGGALFSTGRLSFTDNTDITFSGNKACSSAALHIAEETESVFSGNGDITFSDNVSLVEEQGAYANVGAVMNDVGNLSFTGNGHILFARNSASAESEEVGGGALSNFGVASFSGNAGITFQDNSVSCGAEAYGSSYATAWGGAISNRDGAALSFADTGDILFSRNSVTAPKGTVSGGAIYNDYRSVLTFSGAGTAAFRDNRVDGTYANGGAVCVTTSSSSYDDSRAALSFTGKDSVIFTDNTSSGVNAIGGALYNERSDVSFSENGCVLFSGNSVKTVQADGWSEYANGGAIYNDYKGVLTFTGNESVIFADNSVLYGGNHDYPSNVNVSGGALYNSEMSQTLFSGNGEVVFRDNRVGSSLSKVRPVGGAIHNKSALVFENNEAVRFTGNESTRAGGAIYLDERGSLVLTGNALVEFTDNKATSNGGAIYMAPDSTLAIVGNDSVIFRNNSTRNTLESIAADNYNCNMYLGANAGGSIEFYDLVNFSGSAILNSYTDADGRTTVYQGDIVFTGETSRQDYQKIDDYPRDDEEYHEILRSYVDTAELHGGRLVVKEGANVNICSLDVVENATATVLVDSATLRGSTRLHSGNRMVLQSGAAESVEVGSGAVLEVGQGSNTINGSLMLQDGATIVFNPTQSPAAGADTPMLTVRGGMELNGVLNIAIDPDAAKELVPDCCYALIFMDSWFDMDLWNENNIHIVDDAFAFDAFEWRDDVLYLNIQDYGPVLPETLTWNNGAGDGKWNTSSINWTGDGAAWAYTDGVTVVFTDAAAGEIQLEGVLKPTEVVVDNSAGHDYVFSGEGRIDDWTSLTKRGEGKLTINTANTYTGITEIAGGTVVLGHAEALGSSTVDLTGGTLDIAGLGITNRVRGYSGTLTGAAQDSVLNLSVHTSEDAGVHVVGNGSLWMRSESAGSDHFAIYNLSGTVEIKDNADITVKGYYTAFPSMFSTTRGGAVYNGGGLSFSGNKGITFEECEASGRNLAYGGAIYNDSASSGSGNGKISFSGNASVSFDHCTARAKVGDQAGESAQGGAIYNGSGAGLSMTGNGSISFSGNTIADCVEGAGAAIANYGVLQISDNGDVDFRENDFGSYTLTGDDEDDDEDDMMGVIARVSGDGGAIANFATSALNGNASVTFESNSALLTGGAILNEGRMEFVADEDIQFNGNSAGNGGAIYNSGELVLRANGSVTFQGNSAEDNKTQLGGAIYSSGSLEISGNGSVTFQGNFVSGSKRLLGLYLASGTATLSAGEGQGITFYDTVYASADSVLELNKAYTDAQGATVAATGTITFTGATTKDDLLMAFAVNCVSGRPTEEQILASRTSHLNGSTTLYGGTLEVVAAAQLHGSRLSVADGAGASIRLTNGTLHFDEGISLGQGNSMTMGGDAVVDGALTLGSGSSLTLTGHNTAGSLSLGDAVTLVFDLTKSPVAGDDTALLTLGGDLSLGGVLNISISAGSLLEDMEDSSFALLSVGGVYDESAWNADSINIVDSVCRFEAFEWRDGVLYLNIKDYGPVLPETLTWNNGAGDGKWNASSINWTGDGAAWAYTDGVTVVFTDAAAGEIQLEGVLKPSEVVVDNSAGHDYVFSGDGRIDDGWMSLTKKGEGKLTINTANTYAGITEIAGGTVVLGHAEALGSSTVDLRGGTLDIAGLGITNRVRGYSGTLTGAAQDSVLNLSVRTSEDAGLHVVGNGSLRIQEDYLSFRRIAIVNMSGNAEIRDNGDITVLVYHETFPSSYSTTRGGTVYNGGVLTFSGNKGVTFRQCKVSARFLAYGGAIYNESSGNSKISFSGNKSVSFELCTAYACIDKRAGDMAQGGAIYNGAGLSMTGNGSISFSGNTITDCRKGMGAAIANYGVLQISDNGDVAFRRNEFGIYNESPDEDYDENDDEAYDEDDMMEVIARVEGRGGAIANFATSALNGNASVTFEANSALLTGGAILNEVGMELVSNTDIQFIGNSAGNGGAICNNGEMALRANGSVTFQDNSADGGQFQLGGAIENVGSLVVSGNGQVEFLYNTAESGGAVSNNGTFVLAGNGGVVFEGNTCPPEPSDYELLDPFFYGGALFNNGGTMALNANRSLTLKGNSAESGGAIYSSGSLEIAGNGNVTFRGNFASGSRTLQGLYLASGTGTLSAGEWQNITFYDSVYASADSVLELNKAYTDAKGGTVAATGTITFTGVTTEADLAVAFQSAHIAGSPTEAQTLASRTSSLHGGATLYGGTLAVKAQAVLQGAHLTLADNAGATLLLDNGTVALDGALDLGGGNSLKLINGSTLQAGALRTDGGTFSMDLSGASISLSGAFTATGAIMVELDPGAGVEEGSKHLLLSASSVSASGVYLSGPSGMLDWEDGSLYFTSAAAKDLSGAELTVDSGAELGAGSLTLSDSQINLNGQTVRNNIVVEGDSSVKGGSQYGGVIEVNNGMLSVDSSTTAGALILNGGAVSGEGIDTSIVILKDGIMDSALTNTSATVEKVTEGTVLLTQGNSMAQTKVSAGKLVLQADGATGAAGSTVSVAGGSSILVNNGSEVASAVSVDNGATVQGTGSFSGLSVSNGVLKVGDTEPVLAAVQAFALNADEEKRFAGRIGVMHVEDLGLNNSTIAMDLTRLSDGSAYNDVLAVSGTLTATDVSTISLTLLESAAWEAGDSLTFTLFDLSALDASAAGDFLTSLAAHVTVTLDAASAAAFTLDTGSLGADGSVTLTAMQGVQNAVQLEWVGGKGAKGVWQDGGAQEWTSVSGSSSDNRFHNGNDVLFSTKATVTITGDVAPHAMTVQVMGKDTLTLSAKAGKGGITGSGSLTMDGTGTLKMNAANSYSGGTVINSGTVTATGNTSFGTGTITLNGGTLNLGGKAVANDIEAHGGLLTGATKYAGTLTVADSLDLKGNLLAKSVTVDGTLKAGTIKDTAITLESGSITSAISGKSSVLVTGEASLTGKLSYTGGTTLVDGKLTSDFTLAFKQTLTATTGTTGTFGGNLTLSGGSILLADRMSLTVSNTLVLKKASTLDVSALAVDGKATISFDSLTGDTAKFLKLSAPTEGRKSYEMKVGEDSITVTASGTNTDLTWNAPKGKGKWEVAGKQTWDGSTEDNRFYHGDNVTFNAAASVTLTTKLAPGSVTVTGDGAVTFSGSGSIAGDAALTMDGSSTLKLNATNTYTGGTTITSGTVIATGVDSFGKGDVTLSGGTLNLSKKAVKNTILVEGPATILNAKGFAGTIIIENGATLSLTDSLTGTLVLNGGTLDLSGVKNIAKMTFGTVIVGEEETDIVDASGQHYTFDGNKLVKDGRLVVTAPAPQPRQQIPGAAIYTTQMRAQIDGNRAAFDSIRQMMGCTQPTTADGKYRFAVQATNANSHQDGYDRNGFGGLVMAEEMFSDKAVGGLSLGYEHADIRPEGADKYESDDTRVNAHLLVSTKHWQSRSIAGVGIHDYRINRSSAVSTGHSLNLMQEVSRTIALNDRDIVSPFVRVETGYNVIGSCSDGALTVNKQHAWATDITFGARYVHGFRYGTLMLEAGATKSIGDLGGDVTVNNTALTPADAKRWSATLGGSVQIPVGKRSSLNAGANVRLHGGATEVNANVGYSIKF